MRSPMRSLAALSTLLLATACSFPGLSNPDVVPTRVELTLEALRARAQETMSALPPTATPPPTMTPFPTFAVPATTVPVTLTVSVATKCFAGPSSNYGLVATLDPGTMASVIGKDTADNFWIIVVPDHPDSDCWLSGQGAQLTGDTAALPEVPLPAVSKYTLDEPRNLRLSCSSKSDPNGHDVDWTVVFRWTNVEPNQLGVRVYKNNRQIGTAGPHGQSFVDSFVRKGHGELTYGVQAYNAVAVSSIVTIDLRGCD